MKMSKLASNSTQNIAATGVPTVIKVDGISNLNQTPVASIKATELNL